MAYYNDPTLLLNPLAGATASISNGQLVVDGATGYVGEWWVEAKNVTGGVSTKTLYRMGFSDSYGLGLNWSTEKASTTGYTYDSAGQLTNMQQKKANGTNIANYTYTYDAIGNLKTEVFNGTTTTYAYDITEQVTADGNTTVTYDANGNRNNGSNTVGAGNRLTSDGTWNFTYDDEGNLTYKQKVSGSTENWTYGYDNRNQMTKAEHRATSGGSVDSSADYKYDVYGNRQEKSVDADGVGAGTAVVTKFAYDGFNPKKPTPIGNENWDVWADLTAANALSMRHLRGDVVDQIFARTDSSGHSYWLLGDRLGSIRDVIDSAATLRDHVNYNAFGKIISETDITYRGRYGWTGREQDVETGLYYNRARYYDPGTGRWMSRDPLGFDAGDSNLYRYARQSVLSGTDPSGLETFALGATTRDSILEYLKTKGVSASALSLEMFVYKTLEPRRLFYILPQNASAGANPFNLGDEYSNLYVGSSSHTIFYQERLYEPNGRPGHVYNDEFSPAGLTRKSKVSIFKADFIRYGDSAKKSIGYEAFHRDDWAGDLESLFVYMVLEHGGRGVDALKILQKAETKIEANPGTGWPSFDRNTNEIVLYKSRRGINPAATMVHSVGSASDAIYSIINNNRDQLLGKAEYVRSHNLAWLARLLETDKNVGVFAKESNPDRWFWTAVGEAEWGVEIVAGEYRGVAVNSFTAGIFAMGARLPKAGTGLSWTTNRRHFWTELGEMERKLQEEAISLGNQRLRRFSQANLARMADGDAPRMTVRMIRPSTGEVAVKDISIELHHTVLPQRGGAAARHEPWNLSISSPWAHAAMDPYRRVGWDLDVILRGPNSWVP